MIEIKIAGNSAAEALADLAELAKLVGLTESVRPCPRLRRSPNPRPPLVTGSRAAGRPWRSPSRVRPLPGKKSVGPALMPPRPMASRPCRPFSRALVSAE